jgi:hypothetical protein
MRVPKKALIEFRPETPAEAMLSTTAAYSSCQKPRQSKCKPI